MPLLQTSGNATADAFGGGNAVVPNYIEDVFSTWLFTANGTTNLITNNIDLSTKGGLVVLKGRNGAQGGYGWGWFDTARGVNKSIASNDLNTTITSTNALTAFRTTGFTLGADDNAVAANTFSGSQSASWTFRKAAKFFDVVTYTGTGANRTIAHNLGSAVGCIIVKRTDLAGNWQVYHNSLTSAAYSIQLNLSAAQASAPTIWNSTAPTSSVFSVGTDATVNASGGTYVAYLFAHNAGGFGLTGTDNVISCGSFTSTGSALSVTLGYEPQWLLFKPSSGAGDWNLVDNMRGFQVDRSGATVGLQPNLSAAEAALGLVGPTATGFTFDNGGSGVTYIYIAIRRGPMKVPTDGTKVYNAIARTGNDVVTAITGVGFPPDLVLSRPRTVIFDQSFYDRLRGALLYLRSTSTAVEGSGTASLTSYDMDGITVGADGTAGFFNQSSRGAYISHFFKRAPGFFDAVCYTGTGVARTVTHNLGAVPELMIVRQRNIANDWPVYAAPLGNNKVMYLNFPDAQVTRNEWNVTTPTASVFSLNSSAAVNQSGATYVAYLFATCPGVSKVGSYTGNGTTQAIACGFAGGARFVLIKRTDAAGNWHTYDTARGMTVLTDPYLLLNSTAAETATLGSVTSTTGGFTVNAAILAAINTNAASYIFISIA